MLEADRLLTAQVDSYYKNVVRQISPVMWGYIEDEDRQFRDLKGDPTVDGGLIYLFGTRPDISRALHLAIFRTELAADRAIELNDASKLREYSFGLRHQRGKGITLGPMIVQTIDSAYDSEATRAINPSLEMPGTSLADVHTHPTFMPEQRAIIPSVIVEDTDGEYGGDLNSFIRLRRIRQEQISRGVTPMYADRELKAIFQSFPHLDIVQGLFIRESEYLAALPQGEYEDLLLRNDAKVRSADTTAEVCETLREIGYRASFVEVPRTISYMIFDETQVSQLTADLVD